MAEKRQFPYHSAVPTFQVGQGGRRPAQDPSREYQEPRVYQAREAGDYDDYEALTVRPGPSGKAGWEWLDFVPYGCCEGSAANRAARRAGRRCERDRLWGLV